MTHLMSADTADSQTKLAAQVSQDLKNLDLSDEDEDDNKKN